MGKEIASDHPWLELALKEIGTKEAPGAMNNPKVVKYYADATGHSLPDAVPWCAAFVQAMLHRSGWKGWGNLMARGALRWGKSSDPIPGAIVVFPRGRPPSGHVAIVEKVSGRTLHVVGGNQGDQVSRASYPLRTAIGFRWPTEELEQGEA